MKKGESNVDLEGLKYPIGKFQMPKDYRDMERNNAIQVIRSFPEKLKGAVANMAIDSLAWKYRPGGWNIREVVHHCVDSHMNAFIRFKKALTEQEPQITGYVESKWAMLSDNQELPIQNAIDILSPLHFRWSYLLEGLNGQDLERGYYHLDIQRVVPLTEAIFHYEWHCNHHLAHIFAAQKNKF